jgi:hypothetical protein
MSRLTQEMITCPRCGEAQRFAVWSALNPALSPEERRRLLEGELTAFRCGGCGHSAPVLYPMLYQDTQRRFMAWMIPPDRQTGVSEVPKELPEEVAGGPPLSAYTLRHVTSPNRLIEKVRIFDHWLDDRVVELVKVIVAEEMGAERMRPESELLFTELITQEDGAKAMGFTVLSREGNLAVSVPMEPLYKGISETFGRQFPAEAPGQWVRVDREYALSLAAGDAHDPSSGRH